MTSPPPRPGAAYRLEPLQRCGAVLNASSNRPRGRGGWLPAPGPRLARCRIRSLSRSHAREAGRSRATAMPHGVACVMGDMDLLRPLVLAGIPCAVVTRPGVPSLYSRYTQSRLIWDDYSNNSEVLVDALVQLRQGAVRAPGSVLRRRCSGSSGLAASRAFVAAFRFVIADAPACRGSAGQRTLSIPGGAPRFPGAGGTVFRPRDH